jgi:hypothetical protein
MSKENYQTSKEYFGKVFLCINFRNLTETSMFDFFQVKKKMQNILTNNGQ